MPEPSPSSSLSRSSARNFPSSAVLNALFFWGGLGILATGLKLGLGTLLEPGAGLWPAMIGAGLALCALIPPFSRKTAAASPKPDRRALLGMTLACCLWIGLLLPLGWLATTLLALGIACRGARVSWTETALLMILLAGGLYFGVVKLLNWPLPGGELFSLFSVLAPVLAPVLAGGA